MTTTTPPDPTTATQADVEGWLVGLVCKHRVESGLSSCVMKACTGRRFPFTRECPCIAYKDKADGINHAIDEPPLGLDMCKRCYLFGHQDNFWKTNGYYQVRNEIDMGYLRAVEVLQDDTFEKMDLAAN